MLSDVKNILLNCRLEGFLIRGLYKLAIAVAIRPTVGPTQSQTMDIFEARTSTLRTLTRRALDQSGRHVILYQYPVALPRGTGVEGMRKILDGVSEDIRRLVTDPLL